MLITRKNSVDSTICLMINDIKKPLARILSIDEYYSLSATSSSLSDYESRSATNVIKLNAQKIEQIINDIIELERGKREEKEPPIIVKLLKHQGITEELDISQPDQAWLRQIEEYVEKNMSSVDLKLSDIAYEVAVSERQLYRRIKSLLGLTPNLYVRKLRLYRAKHLIDTRFYKTTLEVALHVGFQDAHYFKKVYTAEYP